MTRSLFISLIGIIALTFISSCATNEKYKVAYLLPSKDYPRFNKEGKYLSEKLKELGADISLVYGDNDEAIQIKKGLELLDKGIDALVITAINGGTIAPLVRAAKDKGVVVVAYNRLISNADYDVFFTGDNMDNARIFCEYALSQKPTGNYVILNGDRFDRNGVELKIGIDSILKPHIDNGSINVVYKTYIENWSKIPSEFELKQIIQSTEKNIDVVISCSDGIATGTVKALEQFGMAGDVIVTGQDADLDIVKYIYNNKMHLTIYHPHKQLGYKAAELVIDLLNGKNINKLTNAKTFNGLTQIPTLQVKSIGITKENIEKELIETGEYTWDQITKN
ncbi:MAG: substrate-binding domain-containing protein [Marinilabiliaceae bacterium]|nr:substrate-binding domain-containing protein [Marinilabiliaceae bacterium]